MLGSIAWVWFLLILFFLQHFLCSLHVSMSRLVVRVKLQGTSKVLQCASKITQFCHNHTYRRSQNIVHMDTESSDENYTQNAARSSLYVVQIFMSPT